MGIVNCIKDKNQSCITDWSFDNILWWVVEIIVVFLLIKFLIPLVQAPFIAKKILKNNRVGKGRGYGTQAADLFLEIWHTSKNYDAIIKQGNFDNTGNSSLKVGSIAEHKLIPYQLVEIFEDHEYKIKKIRAIKNFRNTAVLHIAKFYLIHCMGDSPEYYKNLRINSK